MADIFIRLRKQNFRIIFQFYEGLYDEEIVGGSIKIMSTEVNLFNMI